MSDCWCEYRNGEVFINGINSKDLPPHYGSGMTCPDELDELEGLVEKKYPAEFRYAIGEDKDGNPLKGKELEKWEELNESKNYDWNVPFDRVGYFAPDYCQAHMKQFIAMIEESKTYAELQAKWQTFYKQVPEDKIILICT